MKIIKTFEKFILEAKQVGNVYHFTSFYATKLILESMSIKFSEFYTEDSDNYLNYEYRFSFTRNKNLFKQLTNSQKSEGGIKFEIRLTFDGDLLSNFLKFKPHDDNYQLKNGYLRKRNEDLGDEMEERVYSNTEYVEIKPNYIKEIAVLVDKEYIEKYDKGGKLLKVADLCLFNNIKFIVI